MKLPAPSPAHCQPASALRTDLEFSQVCVRCWAQRELLISLPLVSPTEFRRVYYCDPHHRGADGSSEKLRSVPKAT